MTDKQQAFLLKYISKDTLVSKREFNDFSFVSKCIGFIMGTRHRDTIIFDVAVEIVEHSETLIEQIKALKDHINVNTEYYSGPNDESFSFDCVYRIPESDRLYFIFKQCWCKGVSGNISYHYITVNENGDEIRYNTQYEELFRLNINTLGAFFDYLKRNTF